MLELKEIFLSFGGHAVLSNCSLHLAPGERIALMGPSGCGKTTLLRTALSLQQSDSGTVVCRAHKPAAVFQEPRLLPWLTALENVNLVLSDTPDTLPAAQAWLDCMELGDSALLYPTELSGGMQQRVSLARALACEPDLLVLDEPFKGLDATLCDRILTVLNLSLEGASVLLATHRGEEALALGCRIVRYEDGQFVS